MEPVDNTIKEILDEGLNQIGSQVDGDVVAVVSPIVHGLDLVFRRALEELDQDRKHRLFIILDTAGGVVEIVERMVNATRHFYDEVHFVIPDRAMSAGTIFALSGDDIWMDYFSCLGPVDPQIERDGQLIPALSYLSQYDRLNEKANNNELTTADVALLQKLDLGELHRFEQARELSRDLLISWLCKYKFKNWRRTETREIEVDEQFRRERAGEIADVLSDNERWHSHGRGIDLHTLKDTIGLKVKDLEEDAKLMEEIRKYHGLLRDYMARQNLVSFVHSEGFF